MSVNVHKSQEIWFIGLGRAFLQCSFPLELQAEVQKQNCPISSFAATFGDENSPRFSWQYYSHSYSPCISSCSNIILNPLIRSVFIGQTGWTNQAMLYRDGRKFRPRLREPASGPWASSRNLRQTLLANSVVNNMYTLGNCQAELAICSRVTDKRLSDKTDIPCNYSDGATEQCSDGGSVIIGEILFLPPSSAIAMWQE